MATQKTTQTNYFGNLRTPAANFANSSGINTFAAVSQGAAAAQRGMRQKPRYTQDELDKMRADNVVAANLDSSPQISWGEYKNLPPEISGLFNEKIASLGSQIGYQKHIQQNMGKTDFQGRSQMANQISNMQGIITSKIPQQLATLNEMYGGFDDDYMDGIMSEMMDPKDQQLISDIQHGKIKPEMDDEGNITFNGMSINDLPQYHNKDLKTGAMLTKNLTGAFDRGRELTDSEIALQRVNITNTLNEGGTPSILSVGFEDVMGFGTPLLDKSQYQSEIADLRSGDPMKVREAKQAISSAITEQYLTKLNEQASAGFKNKKSSSNSNNPSAQYGGGKNDILSFYKNHDFTDGSTISFEADGSIAGYNMNTGKNPATSDLGIQLANMGYMLGETTSAQQLYSIKGGDSMTGAEVLAELGIEGFDTMSPEQQKKVMKSKGVEAVDGQFSKATHNLKPLKGGTQANRDAYVLDIDITDPQSVQNAINRLSKLNL